MQVYANRGGIASRILIHEGDRVEKGQPLVELSSETSSGGAPVVARLQAENTRRIAELGIQISAAEERYEKEIRRLAAKTDGIRAEVGVLTQRLENERKLLELQNGDLARFSELAAAGNTSKTELSRRQQQALAQRGIVIEFERQIAVRLSELSENEIQLSGLPSERAEKLSQLRSAQSELAQSGTQLELERGYTVVAPMDGVVSALQADLGQTFDKNAPIVAIVPKDADLEVNLLVPTRSSGFLNVGQSVRLRIDAFPFQRFGLVSGKIVQISRSAYKPGELLAPISYQEPVYRAIVALDRNDVLAYGQERGFISGMTLQADIVIDRRKFVDWILDPLRAAAQHTR